MSPVALILGAGPNIGQAVARTFAAKGYKTALASWSSNPAESTDDQVNTKSDFCKTEDVVNAFEKAKQTFGIPSAVAFTPKEDPFALPLEAFNKDLNITPPVPSSPRSKLLWDSRSSPEYAGKIFIYTGKILNLAIIPGFIDHGIGKSAGARLMWAASAAYKGRGYKFFYADERKADGSATYRVDGDAHAQLFLKLSQEKTQGPRLQTFVKDACYKPVSRDSRRDIEVVAAIFLFISILGVSRADAEESEILTISEVLRQ